MGTPCRSPGLTVGSGLAPRNVYRETLSYFFPPPPSSSPCCCSNDLWNTASWWFTFAGSKPGPGINQDVRFWGLMLVIRENHLSLQLVYIHLRKISIHKVKLNLNRKQVWYRSLFLRGVASFYSDSHGAQSQTPSPLHSTLQNAMPESDADFLAWSFRQIQYL